MNRLLFLLACALAALATSPLDVLRAEESGAAAASAAAPPDEAPSACESAPLRPLPDLHYWDAEAWETGASAKFWRVRPLPAVSPQPDRASPAPAASARRESPCR